MAKSKTGPRAARYDEVYSYILQFYSSHGRMPSYKEIQHDCNMYDGTAWRVLRTLTKQGRLVMIPPDKQVPFRISVPVD